MSAPRGGDLSVLEQRPGPGRPRPYRFPPFEREQLDNGLTIITAHLPGRPLLAAHLLFEGGSGSEPAELAGITSLTARALTEGTQSRTAIELIEAAERLGAELHADAGWEMSSASVDVPRRHFGPAIGLLAEMIRRPSFPAPEVERLRDERLNDLLQARADPRRRVDRAFAETIYDAASPFSRPQGGTEETVEALGRDDVVMRHAALLDPRAATLIVAGDLAGVAVRQVAEEHLGDWSGEDAAPVRVSGDPRAHASGARLVLLDRPGAPQTEIRVGHVGLARKVPDFHAVSVMSSILGGLFNSRLNRLLREERGYTYGIGAGFEFRRAAGPFSVRTAVETDVTIPALRDIYSELERMGGPLVEEAELNEARDYLIGVFPLRFEGAGQVAAAIAGLVTHELPDDELDRYRPAVAEVSAEDVLAAAAHIRPHELSTVLVGDAESIEPALAKGGFARVEVVREALVTPDGEPILEAALEAGT
ncbi:MAG: M16 family metallopeptidase [Candidatus Limnocylindrales bacterium]